MCNIFTRKIHDRITYIKPYIVYVVLIVELELKISFDAWFIVTYCLIHGALLTVCHLCTCVLGSHKSALVGYVDVPPPPTQTHFR